MDKIIIDSLRVNTIIGVNEWERSVKQTLIISVELNVDVRKAAANDRLIDAIDYTSVAERIVAFASMHHFQLIETLAERLAQLLLTEFSIRHVKIYLRKPDALGQATTVEIQIERSRELT